MDVITLHAMAKINLGLDVLRRREDGYHEVKMIMQTVGLHDTLTLEKLPDDEIRITADSAQIPTDGRNLIWRAVDLIKRTYQIKEGVHIHLMKRIPVSAGMAGGSTDAAAAFDGLNKLFELGLSLERMQDLGVKTGADVPYCLLGGTALSEGIGEILTPLPAIPDCYLVIAKPALDVSTRFVYENLRLDQLERHPDIDGMVKRIRSQDLKGMAHLMENVLETVTAVRYPVIGQIKEFLRARGALNALMSGSGPTVFAVFEEEKSAQAACEALRSEGLASQVFLTEPSSPYSIK